MPKPFIVQDYYAKVAQKEGYLARSAYKLKEILSEFDIMRKGSRVLDIGASPGSWLQVASEKVGKGGLVVGVDISDIQAKAKNVISLKHDIFANDTERSIARHGLYDAVISDAAPNTSGIKDKDQALSYELVERSIELSEKYLKQGGCFVGKIFQGPDTRQLVARARKIFAKVYLTKPKASRDRSFEEYIIGINKL